MLYYNLYIVACPDESRAQYTAGILFDKLHDIGLQGYADLIDEGDSTESIPTRIGKSVLEMYNDAFSKIVFLPIRGTLADVQKLVSRINDTLPIRNTCNPLIGYSVTVLELDISGEQQEAPEEKKWLLKRICEDDFSFHTCDFFDTFDDPHLVVFCLGRNVTGDEEERLLAQRSSPRIVLVYCKFLLADTDAYFYRNMELFHTALPSSAPLRKW